MFIVVAKTSSLSVTLTKSAKTAVMSTNFPLDHNRVVIITSVYRFVVGENTLLATSTFTLHLINITYPKMRTTQN